MKKILVVIDMQNDFITGALGSPEAVGIVDRVVEKVRSFDGEVFFTRDTHHSDYLNTQEGRKLPVVHCIEGTYGWEICEPLLPYVGVCFDKPGFGYAALSEHLKGINDETGIESITLVGLCTDICVITNAFLLKTFLPEVPIRVDAGCCAGISPASHRNALEAMKVCQVEIEE